MTGTINILLVEDDDVDRAIVRRALLGSGLKVELVEAVDGAEAIKACEECQFDCVILDYNLPDGDGATILKTMLEDHDTSAAVIFITGGENEELALVLMESGAVDYLTKAEISASVLRRAVRYAIARREFRKQEAESQELLKKKNKRLSELYATAHQFVDNVSHEFRTPLTVIKEFASILADGLVGEMNEEQREFIGIILSRVNDLGLMVDDMLDISRIEAGLLGVRRREHHAHEIVNGVQTTLERKAAASGVTLKFELDAALPTVYCDAENIGRVIINLAVNACKFCGEAGEVKLWARHDRAQSQIVFGVTDNGSGISRENLEVIFTRFKQVGDGARASSQGVGLGLNIAKELVQINFGDIGVESEIGKGSTFTFSVPTFNPVRILEIFAARIEHFRNGSSFASLVTVCADDNTDAAHCDMLEQFLERQMRGNDLIFRTQTRKWLLCAAANQQQLIEMIERIQTARQESKRSMPDDPFPGLHFAVNGIWSLAEDCAGFIAAFETEWSAAGAANPMSLMKQHTGQGRPEWSEAKIA